MLQVDPLKSLAGRVALKVPGDPGDVAFVLGILRRQQRFIGITMAVFLVIGLLIYFCAPPTYRASAAILIDFKRLAALDENFSTPSGRIDSSAVLSQLELLKSANVVNRVVASQKLDEDPEFIGSVNGLQAFLAMGGIVTDPARLPQNERRRLAAAALREDAVAQRIDVSYAMSVTVESRSGEKSARIANAMAEAYIDDQLDAKREASEKASQWFSQRIADLQKDVRDADQNVVDYRVKNNIVTNDGKFVDEQQVQDLSQKLLDASFERASAEAKVERAEATVESGAEQTALTDEFSNEVVIKLRNAYLEERRRMADLALRYGNDHQTVVESRGKIVEIQKALKDEFGRIQAGARSDLAIARVREATLRKELDELSNKSVGARESRIRLAQLESTSDAVKSIRDTFMSRYVEGIQKQSFPITEARIITYADAPKKQSFPTVTKTLGGALVIGFGLGSLMGIAREAFSRKIRFRRQAESAAALPCFGFLPELPLARPAELHEGGLRAALGAPYVETLRSIRIGIDALRQGRSSVVGFVSAGPDEGKTVTASNFAQLCASVGSRTLLVDANLHRSALSDMLTPARDHGLVEMLAGKAGIGDTLVATANPKLHFLPGLSVDTPPPLDGMLSSPLFAKLVRELAGHYDYIVLDLPALALVSDAQAVAEMVDAFVMVVAWNRTETHAVGDVLRNSARIRNRTLGTVLNRADLPALARLGEPSAKLSAAYHG